jgi:hypothetical protein
VQFELHGLVAFGHVEGDLPLDAVTGIDVIEPCAVRAICSAKVNVGGTVSAELPSRSVVDVLGPVIEALTFAPSVGDLQSDEGEPALSRLAESGLSIADPFGMGDLEDRELELAGPHLVADTTHSGAVGALRGRTITGPDARARARAGTALVPDERDAHGDQDNEGGDHAERYLQPETLSPRWPMGAASLRLVRGVRRGLLPIVTYGWLPVMGAVLSPESPEWLPVMGAALLP